MTRLILDLRGAAIGGGIEGHDGGMLFPQFGQYAVPEATIVKQFGQATCCGCAGTGEGVGARLGSGAGTGGVSLIYQSPSFDRGLVLPKFPPSESIVQVN